MTPYNAIDKHLDRSRQDEQQKNKQMVDEVLSVIHKLHHDASMTEIVHAVNIALSIEAGPGCAVHPMSISTNLTNEVL